MMDWEYREIRNARAVNLHCYHMAVKARDGLTDRGSLQWYNGFLWARKLVAQQLRQLDRWALTQVQGSMDVKTLKAKQRLVLWNTRREHEWLAKKG